MCATEVVRLGVHMLVDLNLAFSSVSGSSYVSFCEPPGSLGLYGTFS